MLNIGTLSDDWVESMVVAGRAANRAGVPVVLDPVGAGATTYRTETARRLLAELRIAVVRGNSAEIATLAGRQAQIRGVEASARPPAPSWRGEAARALGTVVAITGPVDHVSDGETVHAVANGHELLGTVTGTGCMSTAITGCFLGVRRGRPTGGRDRGAGRVRRRRRGRRQEGEGPGLLPRRALRRALRPRPEEARLARRR